MLHKHKVIMYSMNCKYKVIMYSMNCIGNETTIYKLGTSSIELRNDYIDQAAFCKFIADYLKIEFDYNDYYKFMYYQESSLCVDYIEMWLEVNSIELVIVNETSLE